MKSQDESEYDLEVGKPSTPAPQTTPNQYTYCTNRRVFMGFIMCFISALLVIVIIMAASRPRETVEDPQSGGTIILI